MPKNILQTAGSAKTCAVCGHALQLPGDALGRPIEYLPGVMVHGRNTKTEDYLRPEDEPPYGTGCLAKIDGVFADLEDKIASWGDVERMAARELAHAYYQVEYDLRDEWLALKEGREQKATTEYKGKGYDNGSIRQG